MLYLNYTYKRIVLILLFFANIAPGALYRDILQVIILAVYQLINDR